jgi:hypothetical protein
MENSLLDFPSITVSSAYRGNINHEKAPRSAMSKLRAVCMKEGRLFVKGAITRNAFLLSGALYSSRNIRCQFMLQINIQIKRYHSIKRKYIGLSGAS